MTASVLRGNPKAIPTPTKDNELACLQALVEAFNLREGRTPNKDLRFITVAELQSAGLVVAGADAAPVGSSGAYVTNVAANDPIESSGGQDPTISLRDGSVTYAKIQDVSTGNTLLGRIENYPGSIEEIIVAGDLTKSGADFILNDVATAGTHTKLTFNAKGLVTSGAQAQLDSADFENQGTVHGLLHGNAAGNPAFGAVDLATADVTGILPDGNIAAALTGKSYNGLTITSTTGTLTIAAGQTLTVDMTASISELFSFSAAQG